MWVAEQLMIQHQYQASVGVRGICQSSVNHVLGLPSHPVLDFSASYGVWKEMGLQGQDQIQVVCRQSLGGCRYERVTPLSLSQARQQTKGCGGIIDDYLHATIMMGVPVDAFCAFVVLNAKFLS